MNADGKQLSEMSTDGQISYWLGQICLAIGGDGNIKTVIYQIMNYYQQEAYQRGIKVGQEQAKNGLV